MTRSRSATADWKLASSHGWLTMTVGCPWGRLDAIYRAEAGAACFIEVIVRADVLDTRTRFAYLLQPRSLDQQRSIVPLDGVCTCTSFHDIPPPLPLVAAAESPHLEASRSRFCFAAPQLCLNGHPRPCIVAMIIVA
jgi:hypothetical protein